MSNKRIISADIIRILSTFLVVIHDLFIKYLIRHNILNANLSNPAIMIPLIVLGIFIFSVLLSYIIKKIPIINKYII
ncbi:hypothetical protein H9660_06145 [Clostridium sp. Sa3CUN1]|uniref:Acyltransferase family protein n=1 Tax=Clostridium gallinarum TaxID=2762246 RepID=A0ABR8Q2R8_9CLOT|nr:hypothetical protein [Clostridium gallinarum]MBD7914721.1 hypothetical protein [Clostridium gallinarum]